MADGNGYECGRKSVSDSLFDDSVPDVEEGCSSSLRREHCFCLNDFFTICGELWAEGRYCAHLRVLADRLYYVDKSEYADLLDFLYRRISDGAYADEICMVSFQCNDAGNTLRITLCAQQSGEITHFEFDRTQFIAPHMVGDVTEYEMLYEDMEAWLRRREREQ